MTMCRVRRYHFRNFSHRDTRSIRSLPHFCHLGGEGVGVSGGGVRGGMSVRGGIECMRGGRVCMRGGRVCERGEIVWCEGRRNHITPTPAHSPITCTDAIAQHASSHSPHSHTLTQQTLTQHTLTPPPITHAASWQAQQLRFRS